MFGDGYMKYGPWVCIGFVVAVLFVIWAIWGGKNYEFIGINPLNPGPSPSNSMYTWGTPSVPKNDTITHATPEPIQPPILPDPIPISNPPPADICMHEPEVENSVPGIPPPVPIIPPVSNPPPTSNPIPSLSQFVTTAKYPPINGPARRRGRFVSRGERMCCQTMERIYGVPFVTVRPNWLRNPETGENLELDCYNEELQLAVEYNGEQHYKWPNFTQQSHQQFINQLRRDDYKRSICKRQGVYLITVPYTVDLIDIPDFIMSHLPETIQKRLQDERILEDLTRQ